MRILTAGAAEAGAETPEPRVIIAIVSYNSAADLVGCLRSLDRSTHRDFHVVICENAGAAAFEHAARELIASGVVAPAGAERALAWPLPQRGFVLAAGGQPVTLLRPTQNLGYAGGVNACIAAAAREEWDAVWVLNPDTFPEPDALAALARRQREGGYGMVGSRLVFFGSGLVQTWGGLEWRHWLGRGRLLGLNEPADRVPDVAEVERRIGFISGASMYVTRAYVDAVGVMDDDFFLYDEDVEWCLRRGAFRLGYAHDSVVRHIHGSTSGSSTTKAHRSRFNVYMTERNRVLLARKRGGWRRPLLIAIALLETVEHLVRVGSLGHFRTALEGWWAGVRGETGMPSFMRAAGEGDLRRVLKSGA
jgi:GT2 family glycosyltransferase